MPFDITSAEFPVELQPCFSQSGKEAPKHMMVVRTDTDEILGVHGTRYKLVTHDDVINAAYDAAKRADVSNDFDIYYQVYENGAKMRGEIIYNDLCVEPNVGDVTKFKVDFLNSYDASWAYMMRSSALRLVCKNGQVTGDVAAFTSFKHTASLNVEASAKKVEIGVSTFFHNKELWQDYMASKIAITDVNDFLKATVCKASTRQPNVNKTNEKQLDKLLDYWMNESAVLGANMWALYNCLTYWATHTDDMRSPHAARIEREQKIIFAMRSKQWEALR